MAKEEKGSRAVALVSAAFMAGYMASFHVGIGLLFGLVLVPLMTLTNLVPIAFWGGIVIALPSACGLWLMVKTEESMSALDSLIAGTLIGLATIFIGRWVWIGFTLVGAAGTAYRFPYFYGQALMAAIPFYAHGLRLFARGVLARD